MDVLGNILQTQANICHVIEKQNTELWIVNNIPRASVIENCKNCTIHFVGLAVPIAVTILNCENIKIGFIKGPLAHCTILRCKDVNIDWVQKNAHSSHAKSIEVCYSDKVNFTFSDPSCCDLRMHCDSSLDISVDSAKLGHVVVYNSFFKRAETFAVSIKDDKLVKTDWY